MKIAAAQLPRLRKLELFDIFPSSLSGEAWSALMHKPQMLQIVTFSRILFNISDRDTANILAEHPGLRQLHMQESYSWNPTKSYIDKAHHVDDESHVDEENHVYLPMKRVVSLAREGQRPSSGTGPRPEDLLAYRGVSRNVSVTPPFAHNRGSLPPKSYPTVVGEIC
jgi:hypothetical protein